MMCEICSLQQFINVMIHVTSYSAHIQGKHVAATRQLFIHCEALYLRLVTSCTSYVRLLNPFSSNSILISMLRFRKLGISFLR